MEEACLLFVKLCKIYNLESDTVFKVKLHYLHDETYYLECQEHWHLIYSPIFNVPQLYLVDAAVFQNFSSRLSSNFTTESSLMFSEHPLMGIPTICVNPCRTRQILNECLYSIKDPFERQSLDGYIKYTTLSEIISILSIYGPSLGLYLPVQLLPFLRDHESLIHPNQFK